MLNQNMRKSYMVRGVCYSLPFGCDFQCICELLPVRIFLNPLLYFFDFKASGQWPTAVCVFNFCDAMLWGINIAFQVLGVLSVYRYASLFNARGWSWWIINRVPFCTSRHPQIPMVPLTSKRFLVKKPLCSVNSVVAVATR